MNVSDEKIETWMLYCVKRFKQAAKLLERSADTGIRKTSERKLQAMCELVLKSGEDADHLYPYIEDVRLEVIRERKIHDSNRKNTSSSNHRGSEESENK